MPAPERVSVVICTRERRECVQHLLQCLSKQTQTIHECLVIDGSDDPWSEIPQHAGLPVRYIHQPDDRGLTQARNEGARRATGDVLVYLDDDLAPPPELLENLLRPYAESDDVMGTGGVALLDDPPGRLRRFLLRLFQRNAFESKTALCQHGATSTKIMDVHRLSGCVMSYRRPVFTDLSWDENLVRYCHGEDRDFSYRAAQRHRIVLVPTAQTPHQFLGWGGLSPRQRVGSKVCAFSYFYLKNLRGNAPATAAFVWLLIGTFAEAVVRSVQHRTLEPVAGFAEGIGKLFRGLDGAFGFIDRDPRRLSPAERKGLRDPRVDPSPPAAREADETDGFHTIPGR